MTKAKSFNTLIKIAIRYQAYYYIDVINDQREREKKEKFELVKLK